MFAIEDVARDSTNPGNIAYYCRLRQICDEHIYITEL
jgi:hypothetical protein